jgi:transposase-like protein
MLEKKFVNEVLASGESKSKMMVRMYNEGGEISEISKIMGVRYNFVYNVVSNYCRVNEVDLRTVEKDSKKGAIIELIEKGLSNNEISRELKSCYNYVFSVRKNYEMSKGKGVK